MKILVLSKRCAKEILRDPLNIFFGLGFPIVILLLLSAIQSNIPNDLFKIESLAPGVSIFGLSFITLFSATLISRDRESAFMERLYTTPLKAHDFIFGYVLPLVPIALLQSIVCYLVSAALGLALTLDVLLAIIMTIPTAVFHIALGLLFGSILNVKQVGGICGALLTNLSAWLSGVWFDISLVGGIFEKAAQCLPFYYAVECQRAIIRGEYALVLSHNAVILIYTLVTLIVAIGFFLNKMKRN